jgi:methylglutaconyl-CoA hydratase
VNKAVSRDRLDVEVDEIVADLLAGAPMALANTKRLIRQVPLITDDEAWELAFRITRETAGSPEALEGAAAFREKRAPIWPAP